MRQHTFVALLRGINITGRNQVAMPALRALAAELGWADARTYIQSGNLVFRAAGTAARLETRLEREIERHFGLAIPVIVRDSTEWAGYVARNPFPEVAAATPNLVMLVLSKSPPAPEAVATLQARAANGESVALSSGAIWIHYAVGFGKSKLVPGVLDRAVGSPVTTRNWRTVLRLQDFLQE